MSQKILKEIIEIIKESEDIESRISLDDIKEEHLLSEDLGLDSIALMSIIYELQEKYEHLDESEIPNIKKIQDLIQLCR